jgi:oxygen-dependent protoporphyrinogen oxidase
MKVLIVGGGISGLCTAYWLHKAGVDVQVLDRGAGPGGSMRSLNVDDWLIETGPNSALETTPLFDTMFRGLGIDRDKLYANAASEKRYILREGRLHALPMSLGGFIQTHLWTTSGKLRLLKEPFIGRAENEETVAQFVERRLGTEFLDYAINPFVAGVYAGNPEQLSVRSAFPKLYALEKKYGGLMKGVIGGARERKKRAEKSKDRAKMFSFAHGMQQFPDAIAALLGDRFQANSAVHGLRQVVGDDGQSRFEVNYSFAGAGRQILADVVVLSVPAYLAGELVRPFDSRLPGLLSNIYYPPVAEVFLGYDEDAISRPLDGFGYLIPAKEKKRILGTIWSSTLFPNRAPKGKVAFTSFVGGSRNPELLDREDIELELLVHDEINSIVGVQKKPAMCRVIRWEKAIPQYNLGYSAITDAISAAESNTAGLFFCANYRGGIAVGDCVMNGERTAAKVAGHLGIPWQRPDGVTD